MRRRARSGSTTSSPRPRSYAANGTFSFEFTHANAQDYSKPSRYVIRGRFSGTQAEGELTAESFAGNTYLGDNENKGASVCPNGGGFGRSVWTASKR